MAELSREEMAQTILDLVAGQPTEPSLFAQADALSTGIGGGAQQAGHDLEYALRYLDAICAGMREHVVKHWGNHDFYTKH